MGTTRSSSDRHKYRPYFTADELVEIITALKESPTSRRINIIQYLESFHLKIKHGVISHAVILETSIEEKLELVPVSHSSDAVHIAEEKCYMKWKLAPQECTPQELERSNQYRYENSLMSANEESDYEIANNLV